MTLMRVDTSLFGGGLGHHANCTEASSFYGPIPGSTSFIADEFHSEFFPLLWSGDGVTGEEVQGGPGWALSGPL